MAFVKCPGCGAAISDEEIFCPQCFGPGPAAAPIGFEGMWKSVTPPKEVDARYQTLCFDEFSTDFAEVWLYLTIVPLSVLAAWGGAYALALLIGWARWGIYPIRVWASPLFRRLKGLALWALAIVTAWRLWLVGARFEAVVVLANRFVLVSLLRAVVMAVVDTPLAIREKALVPDRLFLRRFLGVSDLPGPIEGPAGAAGRLYRLGRFLSVAAAGWLGLVTWIGK